MKQFESGDSVHDIKSAYIEAGYGVIVTAEGTLVYCERRFAETARDDQLTKVLLDEHGDVQAVY